MFYYSLFGLVIFWFAYVVRRACSPVIVSEITATSVSSTEWVSPTRRLVAVIDSGNWL